MSDIQHFGHGDADVFQALVIGQLGGEFIPELIVIAGLVVDLLEDDGLAVCLRQPGIAALAFAQQFEKNISPAVYSHGLLHPKVPPFYSVSASL